MATKYLVQSGADNVTTFATIWQWLASLPSTLTAPETLEIAGDFSYAMDATNAEGLPSTITTSAANYLRIYVPPQYRHDGRPRSVSGKGFRITNTSPYYIGAKYARFEGVDLDITSVSAMGINSGSSSDVRIDGCLIKSSATDINYTILCTTAGTTATLNNTIVYGSSRSMDTRGSASVTANNCVFWRDADNIGVVCTGEFKAYNCYSGKASGTTADWLNQATVAGTNNASSDTTATSAFPTASLNNIAGSAVFKSIVAGTRDFNLATGTNALVDTGTSSTGLTTDAIGTTRPQGTSYDIGALERFTAVPAATGAFNTRTIDGQNVTYTFTTANTPTSGTMTLTATGGGAVTQGPSNLTLGTNTASITFTGVVPGTYSESGTVTGAGGGNPITALGTLSIAAIGGNPPDTGEPTVPTATVTSVTVSPSTATGSTTFSATVNGTNSPSQAVTWSATGGTITSAGVFTAPSATSYDQIITVTATSTLDPSKTGNATVTIAAVPNAVPPSFSSSKKGRSRRKGRR